MKVYLAAPYGARDHVRGLADSLTAAGFVVTSTWLHETHDINAGTQGAALALPDADVAAHAHTDMADIDRCDVFVVFTAAYLGVEGGGGRHVETGYALASDKPVIVVGQPENVFHRLGAAWVVLVDEWVDAVDELEAIAEAVAP